MGGSLQRFRPLHVILSEAEGSASCSHRTSYGSLRVVRNSTSPASLRSLTRRNYFSMKRLVSEKLEYSPALKIVSPKERA